LKKYSCHTGGAHGADYIFENESIKNGFEVLAYSFDNHNTKSNNRVILSKKQLDEGFEHIKIANKRLNRKINNLPSYIKNLISRDWYQVKMSDAIFAVGMIVDNNVGGGTGYAVACAIDNNKPVYVFDQMYNNWFYYDYEDEQFQIYEGVPKLTKNFAGIGTRNINDKGTYAILELFEKNKV
jgi:hypothetical protein